MPNRTSQIIVRIKGGVRAALEARAVAAGFEDVDHKIEDVRTSALAAYLALDVLARAERKVARANAEIAATEVPAVGGMSLMTAVALPLGGVILPALAVALWHVAAAAAVWGAALIGASIGVAAAVGVMAAVTVARFRRMQGVVGSAAYDLSNRLWLLKETFLDVTSAGADRLMAGLAAGAARLLPLIASLRVDFTAIGAAIGEVFRTLGTRLAGLQPQFHALLAQVPAAITVIGTLAGDALTLFGALATVGMPVLIAGLRTVAGWMRDLADWFAPARVDAAASTLRAFFAGARAWWRDFSAPIAAVIAPAIDEASVGMQRWARPLGVLVASLIQIGRILLPPITALLDGIGQALIGVGGGIGRLDVAAISTVLVHAVAAAIAFGQRLVEALKPAAPFFTHVLLPLLMGVLHGFGTLPAIIKVVATALGWLGQELAPLRGAFYLVGEALSIFFGGALLKVAGRLAESIPLIGRIAGPVLGGLGRAWELAGRVVGGAVDRVGGLLDGWAAVAFRVVTGVIGRFTALVEFVAGLPGKIAAASVGMWDGITSGLKAAVGWIGDKLGWIVEKIKWAVGKLHSLDGALGRTLGSALGFDPTPGFDIPFFAAGGIAGGTVGMQWISGEAGPELNTMLPGGRVQIDPLTAGGLPRSYQHLRAPDRPSEAAGAAAVPRLLEATVPVVLQADGRELARATQRVQANLEHRA